MTPEMQAHLRKPFPPEALETKDMGGGKKFTYIAHHAVNRRLLDLPGADFSFTIQSEQHLPWGQTGKGQDIWLHKVVGRILLSWYTDTGEHHNVAADGTGVQLVYANTGEDMWKGAESDALKKAASKLGIGLDLYGADMEAEVRLNEASNTQDQGEAASIDQTVMIQALWKQLGKVVKDKKGHVHHDAKALDAFLRMKYGASIFTIGKENASDFIEQAQAKVHQGAIAPV